MAVSVRGGRELQRALKLQHPETLRQLRREMRGVARTVAEAAGGNAPRGDGTRDTRKWPQPLSTTYQGRASGIRAVVFSRDARARWFERGFHPGGSSTFVAGSSPIGRAIDAHEEDILDGVEGAIDRAARAAGWR